MRDIIISAIVVLLILSLGVFYLVEKKEDAALSKQFYESEIKVSSLRSERNELKLELQKLNKVRKEETQGASRLILVFNQIDTAFVREIMPMLDAREIIGVLTLNKDTLPTRLSTLGKENFNHLMERGWETAVYYDGEVDVEVWHIEESTAFEEGEIPFPTTVVVPYDAFTDKLYGELYDLGFKDIIVKSYQPDITRPEDLGIATVTDSVGWYTVTASRIITLFASRTGDIAFTVGGKNVDESYQGEQFGKMLDTIAYSVDKGLIVYSTPSRSREYKAKLLENEALFYRTYEDKKAELEAKIKELDEKIALIQE